MNKYGIFPAFLSLLYVKKTTLCALEERLSNLVKIKTHHMKCINECLCSLGTLTKRSASVVKRVKEYMQCTHTSVHGEWVTKSPLEYDAAGAVCDPLLSEKEVQTGFEKHFSSIIRTFYRICAAVMPHGSPFGEQIAALVKRIERCHRQISYTKVLLRKIYERQQLIAIFTVSLEVQLAFLRQGDALGIFSGRERRNQERSLRVLITHLENIIFSRLGDREAFMLSSICKIKNQNKQGGNRYAA